jgi:hypothetical protein
MPAAIPLGGECLEISPEADLREGDLSCELRLVSASAMMAGDGSLIMVGYRTSLPMAQSGTSGSTYVLDEKSGKRLGVQNVPFIGALSSRSVGRKKRYDGYFVVDNAEMVVVSGSMITVVVGGLSIGNIAVSG